MRVDAVAFMTGPVGQRSTSLPGRSGFALRQHRHARQTVASPSRGRGPQKIFPHATTRHAFVLRLPGTTAPASIVSHYGGKCWLLNLPLTIFTTQLGEEMGSQRRRR